VTAPTEAKADDDLSRFAAALSHRGKQVMSGYLLTLALSRAAIATYHRWQSATQFTVSVSSEDELYGDLHQWMLEQVAPARQRALVAKTWTGGFSPEDGFVPTVVRYFYDAARQQHFELDGHRIRVEAERGEWGGDRWLRSDRLKFTCPSIAARDALTQVLEGLAKTAGVRPPRLIIASRWGDWDARTELPRRPIESVVLVAGQLERIVEDMDRFLAAEADYAKFGIPWHRGYLFHGPAGTGKAQPLDAPVLTPTGWRPIGELAVHDSVIGSDGLSTEVTGTFDRGVLPIYRLTMSDGATVEASGDHLWQVQTNDQRVDGDPGRVLTTEEIRSGLLDGRERSYYLPQMAPAQFDAVDPLPVDPYLLGLLLGDGTFRGKVELCSGDPGILDAAEVLAGPLMHCTRWPDKRSTAVSMGFRKATSTGKPGGQGKSHLAQAIESLGLYGVHGHDKFIPSTYLTAPIDDRIALLQGLMDTDGGAERTATVFYSSSERLVADTASLVESLGGTATVSSKVPQYGPRAARLKGETAYRVSIRLPGLCPFRLDRKARQWASTPHNPPVRSIVAVDPSRIAEARCITVEAADNLYVTEHCIVTHNTSLAKALAWRFNLDLYYVPLSDIEDDSRLISLFAKVPPRSILLLEDVDVVHGARDRDSDAKGVSSSGLLNALDGVVTPHGLITVLTTNRLDVLDPAMVRPGRADVVEELGHMTGDQLRRLVRMLTGRNLDWGRVAASPASIVEACKPHLDDADAALAAVVAALKNEQ
jgi:hypothetical protein